MKLLTVGTERIIIAELDELETERDNNSSHEKKKSKEVEKGYRETREGPAREPLSSPRNWAS